MSAEITKWCIACRTRHPIAAFGRDAGRGDGLRPQCRNSRRTPRRSAQERFTRRTAAGGGGCIVWTGGGYPSGYGSFYFEGTVQPAHRVAWVLAGKDLPPGLYVLHSCDNRRCVNVEHLFLGTHADNMADMAAKGRHAKQDGEANPNARLTAAQVAEIRALKGTQSQAAIGRLFGVTKTMVRRIHQGKAWR